MTVLGLLDSGLPPGLSLPSLDASLHAFMQTVQADMLVADTVTATSTGLLVCLFVCFCSVVLLL